MSDQTTATPKLLSQLIECCRSSVTDELVAPQYTPQRRRVVHLRWGRGGEFSDVLLRMGAATQFFLASMEHGRRCRAGGRKI
jgi:hypothetical protein